MLVAVLWVPMVAAGGQEYFNFFWGVSAFQKLCEWRDTLKMTMEQLFACRSVWTFSAVRATKPFNYRAFWLFLNLPRLGRDICWTSGQWNRTEWNRLIRLEYTIWDTFLRLRDTVQGRDISTDTDFLWRSWPLSSGDRVPVLERGIPTV
jgi:hypothetical protein